MSARRPWRSGWCGLTAAGWQHARCVGSNDAGTLCVCDCHVMTAPAVGVSDCHRLPDVSAAVAEVVDVAALEQLVETLGQVVALPGLVPPAAHRLRAAAVELLQDLDGAGASW